MVTLKLILVQKVSVLNILAVTGTYKVYLLIIMQVPLCKHLILFITLICTSKAYLESSISIDVISIDSFQSLLLLVINYFVQTIHPSNTKRGKVCMYHKESVSIQVLTVMAVFKITSKNLKNYFPMPLKKNWFYHKRKWL